MFKASSPCKDGSNRVGRGVVTLLVLTVMSCYSSMSSLGLNGLAIRAHKHRGHETQRTCEKLAVRWLSQLHKSCSPIYTDFSWLLPITCYNKWKNLVCTLNANKLLKPVTVKPNNLCIINSYHNPEQQHQTGHHRRSSCKPKQSHH